MIPWSESASAALEHSLARYLADSASLFREAALKFHALPVYYGVGGMSLLRPTGEVLFLDEEDGTAVSSDAKWTFIIYVQAARKFPELDILLPQRPIDATDCPDCDGTGVFRNLSGSICGTCAGLGWSDGRAFPTTDEE